MPKKEENPQKRLTRLSIPSKKLLQHYKKKSITTYGPSKINQYLLSDTVIILNF